MKSKGFTLVELLGVLIILAILFILVYPAVSTIISKGEETIYQRQINKILSSTYDFSLKKINYLPAPGKKAYITLGELKYEGLIDVNIKNPENNEIFPDNLVISINNVGAGYEYSDSNAKLEGNYLYKVEIELLNDPIKKDLLPTIDLENLTKNSEGNYIMTLNLNEEFTDVNYIAKTYNNIDLTSRVKKYIMQEESMVETIDTSKFGIYKIIYSVVDDNGYANMSILNIIVADTSSPTITLPENNTISLDITNFDLMNGVFCEDNSGFCDIEVSGEIDYGVDGKYIITYTAKDPSGNTSTKKRVITVE